MHTPYDPQDRRRAYQRSLDRHGANPKALQWKDYRSAARRFVQVTADLDIAGRAILDAGCGMGDLLPYLYAKHMDFTYTGMDITPEFIDIARERFAGHTFVVGNPFTEPPEEPFDIIICSGVLNANQQDWLATRAAMVGRLFGLAGEAVAFNMAGGPYGSEVRGKVAYADIETIIDFCYSLTPRLVVRNHYHERDFTITLFK